ncbi:MAG: 50S ribosomal protein L17 [Planctomycetia bacterium]
MRHLVHGRTLGRKPPHQLALRRNMACALFTHERIITTNAKAKELRPYAERLITIAKRAAAAAELGAGETPEAKTEKLRSLHYRRKLMQELGGKKIFTLADGSEVDVVAKLVKEIGPRFKARPGGYCRIIKRTERRLGDAAPTAFIELLAAGETKVQKKPRAEKQVAEKPVV